MTDPFGDLEQNVEEIKTVAKKEKEAMGDKTEAVGTIKGGTGFDSPWLVIHAADVNDLRTQLTDNADVVRDIMEALWAASKKFQSYGTVGKVLKESHPTSAAPVGADAAPNGETRSCKHGQMVYKAGVAKASGKPYRLFSCPERDRASQCDAQFLR
jgi:hypothetical protein